MANIVTVRWLYLEMRMKSNRIMPITIPAMMEIYRAPPLSLVLNIIDKLLIS
jgi:hypothetical protein